MALLVSDRAIDTDQGQKILYVVNRDNVVEKRLVKLGGLHDGLREIESGVKAKEQVVVEGIQRVRPGAHGGAGIDRDAGSQSELRRFAA